MDNAVKIGVAVQMLIAIAAVTVLVDGNESTTTPSTTPSAERISDTRAYEAGYQHGVRWLQRDPIEKGWEVIKSGECVGSGSLQPHRRSYVHGCSDAVHGKPEQP
jgi:hypothetical protein